MPRRRRVGQIAAAICVVVQFDHREIPVSEFHPEGFRFVGSAHREPFRNSARSDVEETRPVRDSSGKTRRHWRAAESSGRNRRSL
jgi:hypothetical protein